MNKLEVLIKNLQLGFHCGVKKKSKVIEDAFCYQIFSPSKDNHKDYRTSGWEETLKEAEEEMGSCCGYMDNEMVDAEEIDSWTLLKPFKIIPEKSVEVGEMVLILSNEEKSNEAENKMIGKVYKVTEVGKEADRTITVWNEENSEYYFFYRDEVCYPYESEQKDLSGKEDATEDLEKIKEHCKRQIQRNQEIIDSHDSAHFDWHEGRKIEAKETLRFIESLKAKDSK